MGGKSLPVLVLLNHDVLVGVDLGIEFLGSFCLL